MTVKELISHLEALASPDAEVSFAEDVEGGRDRRVGGGFLATDDATGRVAVVLADVECSHFGGF